MWLVHVLLDEVADVGDKEEVEDVVVLFDGKVKGFVVDVLVGKDGDSGYKTVGPSF